MTGRESWRGEVWDAFKRHTSERRTLSEPFWYKGVERWVICRSCSTFVRASDCLQYGGEGYLMFEGLCRDCYRSGKR